MSINIVVPYEIKCDGDGRWSCRAFHQSTPSSVARDVRKDAKALGWEVNVRNRYGRRRLDYCPEHASADQAGDPSMSAPYPAGAYPGCPCWVCDEPTWPTFPGTDVRFRARMSLCPKCGNKRCPGAADHTNACTGSNEAGQAGSLYGPVAAPGSAVADHSS